MNPGNSIFTLVKDRKSELDPGLTVIWVNPLALVAKSSPEPVIQKKISKLIGTLGIEMLPGTTVP